ncbi:MAG: DUF1707 SHOCT-like domain-containing protein [Trebonia sp.]
MDKGTGSLPRDDIRVSDAERDQAVAELSEHFQAGRLTQEEFDERSGHALRARTGADLGGLFTDLPPRRAVGGPQADFPEDYPGAYPASGPGGLPRPNYLPVARVVIAVVAVTIIAGGLFGHHGHHGSLGWLVPAVLLVLFFLRLARRRGDRRFTRPR